MNIEISKITIGNRRALGDISGLAESIKLTAKALRN